jgi:hypothetical protein
VIIAPSLSIITDRSEKSLGESDPAAAADPEPTSLSNSPSRRESELRKTRIFEYDENDELVEVTDEDGNEDGRFGDDDDDLYDEEYIDVVYEDDDDDGGVDYEGGGGGGNGGYGNRDDELHVFESTSPMEVASHITWM